ncbi:MAG TPA: dinitrogenase iron-molybdenum cofactor biosynthesis protein, partial [Desulfovibrio sp.]|nr:dinitrogenase iron-molybdenum cofactor biosynthesis protein [Desulfovibrio sp.]
FLALSKGRISVHLASGDMNMARAVELYKDGMLPAAVEADKAGHW